MFLQQNVKLKSLTSIFYKVVGTKIKLIAILTLLVLFSSSAFAIPGVPNQFYGYVIINGRAAPDGSIVVAKIDGVEVARTTTKNGKYGYNPIFYVEDPNNDRSGKIVKFYVNGIDTGKFWYFCNGCVTRLDLAIQTQAEGGAEGGAGGLIGGLVLPPEENITEGPQINESKGCIERWLCTEWSECINGIQTRECEDVNRCGTEENKPLLVQPCIEKRNITEERAKPTGITGLFVLIQNPAFLIILILIALAVILTIFRLKLTQKKK